MHELFPSFFYFLVFPISHSSGYLRFMNAWTIRYFSKFWSTKQGLRKLYPTSTKNPTPNGISVTGRISEVDSNSENRNKTCVDNASRTKVPTKTLRQLFFLITECKWDFVADIPGHRDRVRVWKVNADPAIRVAPSDSLTRWTSCRCVPSGCVCHFLTISALVGRRRREVSRVLLSSSIIGLIRASSDKSGASVISCQYRPRILSRSR